MCGARTRASGIGDARVAQPVGEAAGQHGEPLDDRRRAPIRHHLHADRRHFHGDEMIALAHVEAPRVR